MNAVTVGSRVAALRKARNISIAELSVRTGLSASFLNDLERDEAHPSIAPLLRVARGLGVRLGTFIDDRVSDDPYIVRVGQQQEEITSSRGKQTPASLRFHSLGKGKSDRHMEPFLVEVLESANDDSESSHEGEEFLVVISGRLEVRYGGQVYTLDPGDSIYYNSIVPHRVASVGGPASIYAVIYVPA